MFFKNFILNIFQSNKQSILLIINLLFNDDIENMKSMKICLKHLNFHKFMTSVINLQNSYQIELHQIVCTVKDTQYHLNNSKIEFKSALITMYAEYQEKSLLMNLHIINDVNNMLTL